MTGGEIIRFRRHGAIAPPTRDGPRSSVAICFLAPAVQLAHLDRPAAASPRRTTYGDGLRRGDRVRFSQHHSAAIVRLIERSRGAAGRCPCTARSGRRAERTYSASRRWRRRADSLIADLLDADRRVSRGIGEIYPGSAHSQNRRVIFHSRSATDRAGRLGLGPRQGRSGFRGSRGDGRVERLVASRFPSGAIGYTSASPSRLIAKSSHKLDSEPGAAA